MRDVILRLLVSFFCPRGHLLFTFGFEVFGRIILMALSVFFNPSVYRRFCFYFTSSICLRYAMLRRTVHQHFIFLYLDIARWQVRNNR